MLSPGRIRDPIHGYIAFTAIERALLDHPIAQRLRHVGQSAAAHLVYPEMRMSRFAHSLGAMHLASRFLQSSLQNAAPAERDQILAACRGLVDRYAPLGVGAVVDAALASQGLLTGRERSAADRVPVLLVEQGLRLASLVHDLGHLPFSHDFEVALEDFARQHPATAEGLSNLFVHGPGGDAVHERIGYALADVVQREVFGHVLADSPLSKPAEVSLLIARDILNAPSVAPPEADSRANVLSWLHSLVAGEIDVDRADYVLRDARHYGLHAAGYDLERLIDYLKPVATPERGLITTIGSNASSAAEAFLIARFRMYTWAVYQHKIQQAAAGLRVAMIDILESPDDEISTFLSDINAIAGGRATPEAVDRFVGYDDIWWTMVMRRRLRAGVAPHVEPWLALFLRRRPGPVSLWKRPPDFPVADRAGWNARLPGTEDEELHASWERIRLELRGRGVLVERLPFRPWRKDANGESELRVSTSSGLRPLTHFSSLVKALDGAWLGELQVLGFASARGLTTAAEVVAELEPALRPALDEPLVV